MSEVLISMSTPMPRTPVILGVIIDDLIIFERIVKGSTLFAARIGQNFGDPTSKFLLIAGI